MNLPQTSLPESTSRASPSSTRRRRRRRRESSGCPSTTAAATTTTTTRSRRRCVIATSTVLWLLVLTSSPSFPVSAFVLATTGPGSSSSTTTSSSSKQHDPQPALYNTATATLPTNQQPTKSMAQQLGERLASLQQEHQAELVRAAEVQNLEENGGNNLYSTGVRRLPELLQQGFHPPPTSSTSDTDVVVDPTLSLPTSLSSHTLTPQPQPSLDEDDVLEWAGRYTSVEALREHFGTNQNKLWGDLQASTARRLYKTLLPRALLDLSHLQLDPKDLAPLAYQARVAAKLYARERCTVPARIAATLLDGFRQYLKYGKFQAHGMTYDQLWTKYANQVLLEHDHHHDDDDSDGTTTMAAIHTDPTLEHDDDDDDDDENRALAEQVCRKILERACVSNESVDAYALRGADLQDETQLQPEQRHLLETIRHQLEQDMYELLLPHHHHHDDDDDEKDDERDELETPSTTTTTTTIPSRHNKKHRRFRLVKGLKTRRRLWNLRKHIQAAAEKELKVDEKHLIDRDHHDNYDDDDTVLMTDFSSDSDYDSDDHSDDKEEERWP